MKKNAKDKFEVFGEHGTVKNAPYQEKEKPYRFHLILYY